MGVDRLSALDASFLAVESPTAHMHVGWAAIFEPPDNGGPSFEQLREHVARRLPRAPRYRQMLRRVPLDVNAPVWVDDERFEIERHVTRAGSSDLDEVVSEAMSTRLPQDRPLWQLFISDRLDDGRIGVVGKAHHCMVDGIAAVELASLLLDPEPDPPEPEPDEWKPSSPPGDAGTLAQGMLDMVRDQLSVAARLPARIAGSPPRAIEAAAGRAEHAARALLTTVRPAKPAGRLNAPISPSRRLARVSRPLDDLREIKAAFAVKLNDVLLAVAAGAMRRFLSDRPEGQTALKTMVPVNLRPDGDADDLGNRISFIFVDLPCDEPDPVRRLRRVHAETVDRKQGGEPQGADDILKSVSLVPRYLQGLVARLVASPRTYNITVSNIPGPPGSMYMRGCRLAEAYPVVPIPDRHALSIGLTSVGDSAFFGLYADPEALPDVDELTGCIEAEVDDLLALSEREEWRPGDLATVVPPPG